MLFLRLLSGILIGLGDFVGKRLGWNLARLALVGEEKEARYGVEEGPPWLSCVIIGLSLRLFAGCCPSITPQYPNAMEEVTSRTYSSTNAYCYARTPSVDRNGRERRNDTAHCIYSSLYVIEFFLVDNILFNFSRQYHGHGRSTRLGIKMMKYTKQEANEKSKIRLDSNLLGKILLSHGFKSSDNKIVNQISKQHGTFENV